MSKKEQILAASQQLFIRQGINATSVNEICQLAGVTKGGFFHYYASKEALVADCLTDYTHQLWQVIEQNQIPQINKPAKRLKKFLACMDKHFTRPALGGCLLGIAAQELGVNKPQMANQLRASILPLLDLLSSTIAEVAESKSLTVDAKGLAEFWLASYQGGLLLYRGLADHHLIINSLRHFHDYLYKLLRLKSAT